MIVLIDYKVGKRSLKLLLPFLIAVDLRPCNRRIVFWRKCIECVCLTVYLKDLCGDFVIILDIFVSFQVIIA